MPNDTLNAENFPGVIHKDVYRYVSRDSELVSQNRHGWCFTMSGAFEQGVGV